MYVGDPRPAIRAATEVDRVHRQTARNAEAHDRLLERSAKTLADVRSREARRSADDFLNLLARERSASDSHAASMRRQWTAAGLAASAAFTLAASTVQESFQRASSFEGLKRGLTAVTGSADETERQLARLKEAAKQPGLTLREAIEGSRNLQATGMSADMAERSVKAFGNALAIVGRNDAENLRGVFLALTQISTTPFLQGDELRQLQERLPQVSKLLRDAFGTARSEELKEMGVSSAAVLEALVSGLEKLPRATGGAMAAMEDLRDAWDQALVAFGGGFLEPVAAEMVDVAGALERNQNTFKEWGRTVGDIIHGVAYLAESRLGSVAATIVRFTSPLYDLLAGVGKLTRSSEPVRPAVTDVFDAGNAVRVNPDTMRPFATMSKEAKKELEKQRDIVADLQREIQFFGDKSAAAATKQKLLAAGVKDLNSGLSAQALQYAAVLDKMRDAAEVEELIQKRREEAADFQKDLKQQLHDAAAGANRRALDLENEMLGFTPSERFKFDLSKVGQIAASVGGSVAADLKEAQEAFDRLDTAAARVEPFRKRKAAVEELRAAARTLTESFYDAANPAKDKFEEFVRHLERNENLPERFASRVREARRELETWQANPLLVTPEQSQRLQEFGFVFKGLLSSVNDGKSGIALTAAEVQALSLRFAEAAANALDFDRSLKATTALEAYTRAADELREAISSDIELTNRQRIEKLLLTDAYKNLSDAQRGSLLGLANEADFAERAREERQQMIQVGQDLADIFSNVFESVEGGWRGMWQEMLSVARFALQDISRELMRMAFTGQRSDAGGLSGFIANWLGSALGGLFGGGGAAGAHAGGHNIGLSTPWGGPGYAMGTPSAMPGLHWVGERGPELVRFRGGERVFNNADSLRIAGGQQQQVVNNYINISVPPSRGGGYVQPKDRQALAQDIVRLLG